MNQLHPAKTVQVYLPSGEATGLRRAAVTTSTLAVYDVPRARLPEFMLQPEADQPALLIWLAEDSRGDVTRLKVVASARSDDRWRTETCIDHGWCRALVVVNATDGFTEAHFGHLSRLLSERVASLFRGEAECRNDHCEGLAPAWLKTECDEALTSIELAIETLGFRFLRASRKRAPDLLLM